MFIFTGERYYNDYTRQNVTKSFTSLDDFFVWAKNVSCDFENDYRNLFGDYRISVDDHQNRGYIYWFYKIENENGIVYSGGTLTNGKKHVATTIKEWFDNCNKQIKEIQNSPNFVEC